LVFVTAWWSGGGFDGDGVAEGVELGDQAPGLVFGIGAAVVETSA
jgi:hypothetical protein